MFISESQAHIGIINRFLDHHHQIYWTLYTIVPVDVSVWVLRICLLEMMMMGFVTRQVIPGKQLRDVYVTGEMETLVD